MSEHENVVIIGGVAAGMKTASRLRRLDPKVNITVVEKGLHLSYAACGMPYYVEGLVEDLDGLMDTPVGTVRNAAFFKAVKGVTVHTRTLAERIDRQAKRLHVKNLETGQADSLPYDKLVIATGAKPFVPPIEGTDLEGLYGLYKLEEAQALRQAVEEGKVQRAVLIGGGLIGMETAEALVARGVKVTVIEMLDHILPALIDSEPAAFLTKHLRAKGVTVMTGTKVTKIEGDDHGHVSAVVAGDQRIAADMVLMAVGVRPNVDLAKEAGIELGGTGAIAINDRCQTSDPDIYAGGDCAEAHDRVTGKDVYIPLGSTANKHGRVIADNLAGRGGRFDGITRTCIFKAFDFTVARVGLTEHQARQAGHNVRIALSPAPDKAHYYPTNKPIMLKLIADADSDKLLGGQAVGPGDCAKRIDVLATALYYGASIDDLAGYDLSYAPPYNMPLDNVCVAGNILRNKRDGLARSISPHDVYAKLKGDEDFVLLDVRTPAEIEEMRIDDPRVTYIGLGKLREQVDELPRDKPIIPFCKISLRGYEAQRILNQAGFENVQFMDGGIVGWPYEVKTGG